MATKVVTGDGHIGPGNDKVKFTPEGGIAVRLINKTSAPSVKGTIVVADSTTDDAFKVATGSDPDCIGVVYDDGVADGSECWVVTFGIAEVLLKDATASTRGYWVQASDTGGRADATNAAPPGGGVTEIDRHFTEVGHCIEFKNAGTNVLCKVVMHFN